MGNCQLCEGKDKPCRKYKGKIFVDKWICSECKKWLDRKGKHK